MNEKGPPLHKQPSFEIEEKAVTHFVERIKRLQERYHVHGHGVSTVEEAASIEQNGLYTAWSTLQDLTYALS